MFIVIACVGVCYIMNFETYLSFLIMTFSYIKIMSGQICKYLKHKNIFYDEIYSSFLKSFH